MTPAVVYHLILILHGPHLSVMILTTDQEDASINCHWLEYLDKTWYIGSALRKLRDPLSARITVIAASGWSNSPSRSLSFRDDTDNRSGGCTYQWRTEEQQIVPSLNTSACRVCFQETEGSSQCQGNRGPTCSGWSTSPAPTTLFRDDTDGMML